MFVEGPVLGLSYFLCKWSWLVDFESFAIGHGGAISDWNTQPDPFLSHRHRRQARIAHAAFGIKRPRERQQIRAIAFLYVSAVSTPTASKLVVLVVLRDTPFTTIRHLPKLPSC